MDHLRKAVLDICNEADGGRWLAIVKDAKAKGIPRRQLERLVKQRTSRLSVTQPSLLLVIEEVYEERS